VLGEVEAQCVEMKHLGSYPMGCCDMSCDYEALAGRGVQGLSPYQPGKPIEEVAREIGLDPANIIKLASNENPLGPSEKALAAIREALPEITRYPDGNAFHLKQKLAERLGVSSDCLTLGNGSNDVLEIVARAFAEPGTEVVYSEHAFAIYPIVTQAIGATGVQVPAVDWGHDLDAMADAVTERTGSCSWPIRTTPPAPWWRKRASIGS